MLGAIYGVVTVIKIIEYFIFVISSNVTRKVTLVNVFSISA